MSKLCSCCKLPDRLFGKNSYSKDGLHSWCKQCRAEHQRKIYASDPNAKERYAAYARKRKEGLQLLVNSLKAGPCSVCGNKFPIETMDFLHVRGEKDFDLSRAASMGIAPARIIAEASNCAVVCACCLRIEGLRIEQQITTTQP